MNWMEDELAAPPTTMGTWVRFAARGAVFISICAICLLILVVLRQFERLIWGARRPLTSYLVQFVCRCFFGVTGIRHKVSGTPMVEKGVVVSNHSSWIDIFSLAVAKRIFYVSKAEVRGWPGIGILARATGTIFINRDRREAKLHQQVLSERLRLGHKLLFFPEGTSTDSIHILPFKTTLFASLFDPELHDTMYVQPVTLVYRAPKDQDRRFYGWWGDMGFGEHLVTVFGARHQGMVEVIYHPALKVEDFADRKALSHACEALVRSGLPEGFEKID